MTKIVRPCATIPREYPIGLVGFEPTASWSRTRRSTKLSHSPKLIINPAHQPGARPYFACFATSGKQFTLRCHSKHRVAEGVAVLVSGTEIK
jgi:hypothetical protein